MAKRRCCPDCGSVTLSGAAPSYICMDCDCEFRIVRKGVTEVMRISARPVIQSDTPLF